LGAGLPEVLAPIFLAVGTADFDGDAMIWSHRTHLEHPRPLKEDGPLVAFRRWTERFWPEDWAPNHVTLGTTPTTAGEQPRSLPVLG
jgi:hypothetical protein